MSIRYSPIGIAPSSSDRTFAGSIIIKSSIFATKFLPSARNKIFIARTFTSMPESALPRFQFSLPDNLSGSREQVVMAYSSHSSTAPYVLAGSTIFNFQGAPHPAVRLLKGKRAAKPYAYEPQNKYYSVLLLAHILPDPYGTGSKSNIFVISFVSKRRRKVSSTQ